MICFHVDVPIDAPQVLAFEVDRGALTALRGALRAALERADGRELERLWRGAIGAYSAESKQVVWEVSPDALSSLAETFAAARTRALAQLEPELSGGLERFEAACTLLEGSSALRVNPSRWFAFVLPAQGRLMSFLQGGPAPMAFQWGYWAAQLDQIQGPDLHNWQPDTFGELESDSLHAELRVLVQARLFAAVHEPGPQAVPGREVALGELPEHRILAVLADGRISTIPHIRDAFASLLRVRSRLELLRGPSIPSSGPGPFLPLPSAAEPLVDPGWDCHPLLRHPQNEAGWLFLEGAGLSRTLLELPEHPEAWFRGGPEAEEMHWGEGRGALWQSWAAATPTHWPRCRARFKGLLELAESRGNAVVLTLWYPDASARVAPLSPDLGARFRLP